MKFVFPIHEYKEKAIDFINEFYEHGSDICGSGGLDKFIKESTYEQWIEKITKDINIDADNPEERVPAIIYFYVNDDDRIVGIINIRLELNDFLRKECGNISYSVRPTERGKHYATDMLNEAVSFCRKIGLEDIILTCDKSNPASAEVIKKGGGELDKEFYSERFGEVIQRFVVK